MTDEAKTTPAAVTLECYRRRTMVVARDATDPPNVARVRCRCDRCDDGDHDMTDYFDAQGRQINVDGEVMSHGAR